MTPQQVTRAAQLVYVRGIIRAAFRESIPLCLAQANRPNEPVRMAPLQLDWETTKVALNAIDEALSKRLVSMGVCEYVEEIAPDGSKLADAGGPNPVRRSDDNRWMQSNDKQGPAASGRKGSGKPTLRRRDPDPKGPPKSPSK